LAVILCFTVGNFSLIIRRKVAEDEVCRRRRLVWADCVQRRTNTSSRTCIIYNNNADEMRRRLYTAENGTAQLCANSDHRIYYNI